MQKTRKPQPMLIPSEPPRVARSPRTEPTELLRGSPTAESKGTVTHAHADDHEAHLRKRALQMLKLAPASEGRQLKRSSTMADSGAVQRQERTTSLGAVESGDACGNNGAKKAPGAGYEDSSAVDGPMSVEDFNRACDAVRKAVLAMQSSCRRLPSSTVQS